jgi:uncharacterized protein involved in outer membrane biogenesis
MSRRKKIYLWVAGSIGVLLILLLALVVLLPRLINLELLRERILADVSQTVGGVVEFEKIDLSFFPRPHVVIHQASLSVPGKAIKYYLSLRQNCTSPDFRLKHPISK